MNVGGSGRGSGRGGGAGRRQAGVAGAGAGRRRRHRPGCAPGVTVSLPAGDVPVEPQSAQAIPIAAAATDCAPSRLSKVASVARPEQCTLCWSCLDVCSRGAITLRETVVVDQRLCKGCGACLEACPNDVFAMEEV